MNLDKKIIKILEAKQLCNALDVTDSLPYSPTSRL